MMTDKMFGICFIFFTVAFAIFAVVFAGIAFFMTSQPGWTRLWFLVIAALMARMSNYSYQFVKEIFIDKR